MIQFIFAPWKNNEDKHDAPHQPVKILGPRGETICTVWVDDADTSSNSERYANARLIEAAPDLHNTLAAALVVIAGIYTWLEQIEAVGGATNLSGIAKCHAFLQSLRRNEPRLQALVLQPADKIFRKVHKS